MNATTQATRTVGAMVRYHGTIASEHWAPFYISAIDDRGRLTLIDRDYPNVTTLRGVRPGSVTPTGEMLDLCGCGHEAAFYLRSDAHYINEPTVCGVCGWACTNHTSKEH